jgi:actin-like protein 6A
MMGGDETSALVIDVGTSTTKAGFAGEDCPKFVFPSAVGVVGGEEGSKATRSAGTNALSAWREGMRVEHALKDGAVTDWDAYEALLRHAYASELRVTAGEHPLLLAEPNTAPDKSREKTAEIAFESLGVPALYLGKNAVLSAFAAGRATALVLDVGGGHISATPVCDGYVLQRPSRSTALGGGRLDEMLLAACEARDPAPALRPLYSLKRQRDEWAARELPNTHPSFARWSSLQLAQQAKETVCRVWMVSPTAEAPLDLSSGFGRWEHQLADGSKLDLGWERFHLPEQLFTPTVLSAAPPPAGCAPAPGAKEGRTAAAALRELLPAEHSLGLPAMVSETISACDPDVRRDLWGGVVVSGGGSLLPGLVERLQVSRARPPHPILAPCHRHPASLCAAASGGAAAARRADEAQGARADQPAACAHPAACSPASPCACTPSRRCTLRRRSRSATSAPGSAAPSSPPSAPSSRRDRTPSPRCLRRLTAVRPPAQLWMSKAEYDEHGAGIVHRKCA